MYKLEGSRKDNPKRGGRIKEMHTLKNDIDIMYTCVCR
jgi:hypothetical protein